MMTCVKTGAVIFVDSDNCYYRCDVHRERDLYVFRISNASATRGVSPQAPWATVLNESQWFDKGAVYSTLVTFSDWVEEYPHE